MTLRPEPYERFLNDATFDGLAQLRAEAEARGISMGGLALAWVLANPLVTSPIIGPRKASHFTPVTEALSMALSPEERADLTNLFPQFS
jgi:aryl-alcohol dehydrogenase-like predicted oxidoreductase